MLSLLLLTPALAPAEDVDFLKDVYPILESRCYECHGERKQKGKLRLDTKSGLLEGDGIVVPGSLEDSLLFELVSLPADDPEIMPNEGDPLTKEQIAILKAWIEQGATYVEPPKKTGGGGDELVIPDLSETQIAARDAARAALDERGILTLPVAREMDALDLNASLLRDKVGDAEAKLVAGLEPVLVWANFSGTVLGDAGLESIGRCGELRRLNVSRTKVTDAGMAKLAGLGKLQVLNLYGTKITDAGLAQLQGLKGLKKVFLWQTDVTDEGVDKLVAALPGLVVNRGIDLTPVVIPEENAAVNATCPVSGEVVNAKVTSEVDAQLVAFCCEKCKAKFDADPAAFLDKVPELKKTAGPINDKCPVSDKDVDANCTSTFGDKVVAFCCGNCKKTFDADPSKFAAKLGLK